MERPGDNVIFDRTLEHCKKTVSDPYAKLLASRKLFDIQLQRKMKFMSKHPPMVRVDQLEAITKEYRLKKEREEADARRLKKLKEMRKKRERKGVPSRPQHRDGKGLTTRITSSDRFEAQATAFTQKSSVPSQGVEHKKRVRFVDQVEVQGESTA